MCFMGWKAKRLTRKIKKLNVQRERKCSKVSFKCKKGNQRAVENGEDERDEGQNGEREDTRQSEGEMERKRWEERDK